MQFSDSWAFVVILMLALVALLCRPKVTGCAAVRAATSLVWCNTSGYSVIIAAKSKEINWSGANI